VWQEFQSAVPAELQPAVREAGKAIAAGMAAEQGEAVADRRRNGRVSSEWGCSAPAG
jgi:hypothetical protein